MATLTPNQTITKSASLNFTATLIITGLIAGTLDILSAVFILAKGQAAAVFRYIAGAAFGREAARQGAGMVAMGGIFHYFIAFCWVALYFIAYKYVSLLRRNIVLVTIFYGLFVWLVMNMVILPMTKLSLKAFSPTNAIINAVILMICIALPAVWMRRNYEAKKQILV